MYFHGNLEEMVLNNQDYRAVLYTSRDLQIVAMSIPPKTAIGAEVHEDVTQSITIYEGIGKAILTLDSGKKMIDLNPGDNITIPPGTWHDIRNRSSVSALKLASFYLPPEHPPNLRQKNKPRK